MTNVKSRFKRLREAAREEMGKNFIEKLWSRWMLHEGCYRFFFTCFIAFERRCNADFSFLAERKSSEITDRRLWFLSFFSASQFERFNFITMDVRWETNFFAVGRTFSRLWRSAFLLPVDLVGFAGGNSTNPIAMHDDDIIVKSVKNCRAVQIFN